MARPRLNVALAVVVAALAVGGFLFVRFQQTVRQPVALATDAARRSSDVRDTLGEPLRFGRLPQARVRGANAHLVIEVRGSRGNGLLIEWAQTGPAGWQLCSLLFRDQRTTTDIILVSQTATHCARE